MADAGSQSASGPTFVRPVEGTNLTSHAASVIKIRSPFPVDTWRHYLQGHPDKEFSSQLLKYIQEGVPLGYTGPDKSQVSPNWPSTIQHRDAVQETINTDISRGRKAGPYPVPPFQHYVGSPMGAFTKKHSTKVRVIHDLSWPPGRSVNDYIDSNWCTLQYISVQDAVKYVKQYGPGTLMSKSI